MKEIKIGKRIIGQNQPPLILAEVGINHEGDYKKAIQLIDAAVDSGAEAIKFQCHLTQHEMLETDMKPGDISDERLWDIIKRCELSESEESSIFDYCLQKDILFLSTPFSREAADRLENLGVEAYKIGSGECNNLPLIKHIARKKKPIILSTGMNDIQSIKESVNIIELHNCPLILMHCTSMYPTPYPKVRLGAITELQKEFPDTPIGLSDHSLGIATCLGGVALGACIFEKHFTISRSWPGPDTGISIEPNELADLIRDSKIIWESRGGSKTILNEEKPVIDFAYASVVSISDIKKGEKFTEENIWVKRPGNGAILAKDFESILGKVAENDIKKNSQLQLNDIKN
jgi:N-acetylneuraminate synthase